MEGGEWGEVANDVFGIRVHLDYLRQHRTIFQTPLLNIASNLIEAVVTENLFDRIISHFIRVHDDGIYDISH